MLSCLLLSMCAWTVCLCFFFLYQITDMQTVVHFSELWPSKLYTWIVTLAALVWPKPPTASTLHPQVFYSVSFHSPSFMSLRPKPHSWPNMAWSHQSDASEYLSETLRYFSDTTVMEAEKKKPILLSWFLERDWGDTEQRDDRSQTS